MRSQQLLINCYLGNLFNAVINNRLIELLDKNNIINNTQIGFKRKTRAGNHIYTYIVNAFLQKHHKNKEQLNLCFVDSKKAFDSVWHLGLKVKLLEYGISGKLYDIIGNMYNRKIFLDNLFNLYINYLPKVIGIDSDTPGLNGEPINCLLYADDLIIFSRTREELQNKLNILYSYCKECV